MNEETDREVERQKNRLIQTERQIRQKTETDTSMDRQEDRKID